MNFDTDTSIKDQPNEYQLRFSLVHRLGPDKCGEIKEICSIRPLDSNIS